MAEAHRQFTLCYFSEVSTVIDVSLTRKRDGKWVVVTAKHGTHDEYGTSMRDWFHFSSGGEGVGERITHSVPAYEESPHAVFQALNLLAEDLWPGPAFSFSPESGYGTTWASEEKRYENFRQDLLYAFLWGELVPAGTDQSISEDMWVDWWRSDNFEGKI